ncbi:hypothetical protein [Clostridioides sp. ZZV15-6598]|uniref:hypothetical protein n=1 Tax=Clostridioides sp. ZZV15-6598 TaxID=2811501 RepID=UPI001D12CDBF|nr:hypothetical protein [Clostridioides sp. ZZV15-6598]
MEYREPYEQKELLEFIELGEAILEKSPLKFQRFMGRMEGIINCLNDEEKETK